MNPMVPAGRSATYPATSLPSVWPLRRSSSTEVFCIHEKTRFDSFVSSVASPSAGIASMPSFQ